MVSSGSSAHCIAPVCEANHASCGSRISTYTAVQICEATSERCGDHIYDRHFLFYISCARL